MKSSALRPALRFSIEGQALPWLLIAALLVRLALIGTAGFPNDIGAFAAWAMALADHPMSAFYAGSNFADYPPGYFYVLWLLGHAYRAFVPSDPTFGIIRALVKLPGILGDVADTALVYAIVGRFAARGWAFAAATCFALNPAFVYVSAYWGQVDSVPAAFALLSLYLMLTLESVAPNRQILRVSSAWLLLAYSILVKPPAIIFVPLYLAYVFSSGDPAMRRRRALGTLYGALGSFVLAYLCSEPFHPDGNPIRQFAWLYERYHYAASIYAFNSVNAFNTYVLTPGSHFWVPDSTVVNTLGLQLPQYLWGIIFLTAAIVRVGVRLARRREPIALLEAAMIVSLGYFVLSTRMHERYVYNAVVLATPLIFYARRYLYATIVLSATLFANLAYSYYYVGVMNDHTPGVDGTDLIPWLSHPAAAVNVITFGYLTLTYLGSGADVLERYDLAANLRRLIGTARDWYSPIEGTARMLVRDWWLAAGLACASFGLTFVGYVRPNEKIFDEIYYARAGEEYLGHKEIFEFTHPPLTKLWITFSMMLFGGLGNGGDTPAGWRFLNLVVGAAMVFVIYCFAKRLLGSTLFATIAASLLLFDGFHFVQSRIATPEITVAFFALLTLYAFYRYWLASQVRVVASLSATARAPVTATFVAGLAMAAIVSGVVTSGQTFGAHAVAFGYVALGAYLVARTVVPRFLRVAVITSFPDGSRIVGDRLEALDGGSVPLRAGVICAGESTRAGQNELAYESEGVRIEYARDGSARYATNGGGDATFSPDGTVEANGVTIDARRDANIWLVVLSLSAGALAASKWNGLFDFFVIWLLACGVAVQAVWSPLCRAMGRVQTKAVPAVWGNPFGISLDVLIGTMLFVAATVYALCYLPYFRLGHSLADLLSLQQQMFGYHYDLRATHPYGSKWWQWPLIGRPISYYFHDFRIGDAKQDAAACCVAEILALPNPAIWWLGLISIPAIAILAWRERHKGYALLVTAYLFQWLPWATSPRVVFEYHFFPNLAIICLADAALLQRVWRAGQRLGAERADSREAFIVVTATLIAAAALSLLIGMYALPFGIIVAAGAFVAYQRGLARWPHVLVAGYLALAVTLFVFFYPVLAGSHVPWSLWDSRMWQSIMNTAWI